MGLDQYLYTNSKLLAQKTGADEHNTKHGQIGYWRKANAIHGWFINHCQDGVDDQRTAEVTWESLCELRDNCNQVLSTMNENDEVDQEAAESILPVRQGFFFGGYDYDEYYIEDLRDTVALIDKIEENTEDGTDYGIWGRVTPPETDWKTRFYYGCWW